MNGVGRSGGVALFMPLLYKTARSRMGLPLTYRRHGLLAEVCLLHLGDLFGRLRHNIKWNP